MQPTTPSRRRSPLLRYAPFIAIVAVIVVIAAIVALGGGDDDDDVTTEPPGTDAEIPVQYEQAKAEGKEGDYTWQDNCDEETGRVAIPVLDPAPCVPEFEGGDNGGATAQGVTADTIRVGYYEPLPDPAQEALLRAVGAYDPPEQTQATLKDYVALFESMYETYGRKIELVKIEATGTGADEQAARNDAERAAQKNLFAMFGGPAQAKGWSETLAANKILCIGSCIIAQPQSYYEENSPYLWPSGPSPDQAAAMLTEFVSKQLKGKPARYAGDPDFQDKERTFVLLTYDTTDGQFKESWDNFETMLADEGIEVVDHVNYFLNIPTIQQDARTIATRLKSAGATSVIFTGDPLLPRYFTAEATKQDYFPEWIMGGTVYADTAVFGRSFDQRQWSHAFGLQLTPARLPQELGEAFSLYQWWYGEDTRPPSENSYAITAANVALLFRGIQTAGADLTPETFRAGQFATNPTPLQGDAGIRTISTYGDHGYWDGDDVSGLDNAGILWWDPDAPGEDETGADGKGMYRLVDGGRRHLPGEWPTDEITLFDEEGTVTIYDELPPDLTPKQYPTPDGAPAAK
jgi:hypothetical protein